MHPDEIRRLILAALPDAEVTVHDLTGGGDHFEVAVVSAAFSGKTLLDQHQLVYQPLRAALADRIHALTLKTYSPEQRHRSPKPLPIVS
jgi:acid stress-induced BolA-like protein IbaG/YrbA